MRVVEAELGEVINLGVVGEHLVTKVIFNPSSYKILFNDYMEDVNYEDGFFSLFIEQNGVIYPQTIFKTKDNKLIWYVNSKNTSVAGSGRAQLLYILDHAIELSEIFDLEVTGNILDSDKMSNEDDSNVVAMVPTTLEIDIAAGQLTVEIAYEQTIDGGTTINWGDGTPSEVYIGTDYARHTYAASGTYTITIVPVAGNEVTFVKTKTSADDEVVRASFGTGVTEIDSTFTFSEKLVEVRMQEVHIIGPGSFAGAPLESVSFGTGPITIGTVNMGVLPGAFSSCALESVQIPQAVTLLGADSFRWSSLRTAEVAAETISYRAFGECNDLTQVWIRDTVQTINALSQKNGPFEGCNASQLTIYCEADEKPNRWSEYWANVNENTTATVVWGQKTSPF